MAQEVGVQRLQRQFEWAPGSREAALGFVIARRTYNKSYSNVSIRDSG